MTFLVKFELDFFEIRIQIGLQIKNFKFEKNKIKIRAYFVPCLKPKSNDFVPPNPNFTETKPLLKSLFYQQILKKLYI
jgi:hypothetical protein